MTGKNTIDTGKWPSSFSIPEELAQYLHVCIS